MCERTFDEQSYEVYCVSSFSGGRFAVGGAEMAIIIYGGPEHRVSQKPSNSSRGTSRPSSSAAQHQEPAYSGSRQQKQQSQPESWLSSWLGGSSLQPTPAPA
eukprot:6411649-Amphidinium_carterae.1